MCFRVWQKFVYNTAAFIFDEVSKIQSSIISETTYTASRVFFEIPQSDVKLRHSKEHEISFYLRLVL